MSGDAIMARMTERYPSLSLCGSDLCRAVDLLTDCFSSGGKLLVCGNGGSAADSEHIAGELMKGFVLPRPVPDTFRQRLCHSVGEEDGGWLADRLQGGLPCIALTGAPSLATAIANDTHGEMIFAQQVYALGRPGDVLLGISTSGNSRNVLAAFQVAKATGVQTIALTGRSGGKIAPLADVAVQVPADATFEIQELHLPCYHALCLTLEERFFGKALTG